MAKTEPAGPGPDWETQLAEHLLTRHLQVSWPLRDDPPHWMSNSPEAGLSDGSWLEDEKYDLLTQGDLRTVAVVGAGASLPLPISTTLIAEIESEYTGSPAERTAALRRLEMVYGFDPESFEARLAAISGSPEALEATRSAIVERLDRRQPTRLPYELLAHLVKHRFLDAIITFNFDELLDQSLRDELGDSEFRRVVTERDCEALQLDPTASDYLPLYIKMHGTTSEPMTLRFTHESYYATPARIVEAVEAVLDTDHCVMLNIGYQMANFDFQYLLRRPRKLSLFHMDPKPLATPVVKKIRRYRKAELKRQDPSAKYRERFLPIDCDPPPRKRADKKPADAREPASKDPRFVEKAMKPLIAALEAECKNEGGKPRADWRSIERHRAVVELLSGTVRHTSAHLADYLRRRTIIEIAFAAAKGRGVLSIEPMMDDRPGRCYDDYCRRAREAGRKPQSWSMLCRAGGLVRGENSPLDTYHVAPEILERRVGPGDIDPSKEGSEREEGPPAGAELPALAQTDPGHGAGGKWQPWHQHRLQVIDPLLMARQVVHRLDPNRWPLDTLSIPTPKAPAPGPHAPTGRTREERARNEAVKKWPKEARALYRALRDLHTGTEVELYSTDDRICSKVFEEPLVMVTLTAMHGWTRRLVTDRRYDEIWVAAESGAWLTRRAGDIVARARQNRDQAEGERPHMSIRLIAAFTPEANPTGPGIFEATEDELRELFGFTGKGAELVRIERRLLPWYRHNRHMTILARGGEPLSAIHFARRLRTPSVTPVLVDTQADLRRVRHSFGLLWDEAEEYMKRMKTVLKRGDSAS